MRQRFHVATLAPLLIAAAPAPPEAIAGEVSANRLRETVTRLVSFGTRHTLSSQTDPKRGIGVALRWTEAEFLEISRGCSGCLTVALPSDVVTGRRIPVPTKVVNVIAVQRGTVESDRAVIISAHIDSRVSDVMNFTADAPGANDDGSGTAAVIEAARVLSKHKFPVTIVYAVLSGEEQGLVGGKILAAHVKKQGWQVMATLNNDIIGNSCSSDGSCDADHVRVFSEGPRADAKADVIAEQRSRGGENDSPSRNISRFVDKLADELKLGLDVRQIWRTDRFGRGGDHLEMLNAGYPAVRFTVAVEDYDHQHQDLRVEKGVKYGDTIDEMDFAYLAKVTKLNVATLASIARAPRIPAPVVEGAVANDTTIEWGPASMAARYRISWRRTDAAQWEKSVIVPATVTRHVLKGVRIDDWVFGVSAISADGCETPVASAVPGGMYGPLPEVARAAQGPAQGTMPPPPRH